MEAFRPELVLVTHTGGNDLTEPVVVHPTSEAMFGEYMARRISSYRDLPQGVVRGEP